MRVLLRSAVSKCLNLICTRGVPLLLLRVLGNKGGDKDARLASLVLLFFFATMACCLPLFDLAQGLAMPSDSLPTIAISLWRLQGKNSASFMLFLLSLDFGSAFGRQHEKFVERE